MGGAIDRVDPILEPFNPRAIHRARLVRPRPSPNLVRRPRLLDRLDAPDAVTISVTAPAGFGKTTLLTDWVESRGIPAAWITLDDDDNDLVRFVSHLIAAVQTQDPDFGFGTLGLLDGMHQPTDVILATTFSNDALDLANPVTLVLDDAHVLTAPAPLAFIDALLRHPTPLLRLVLAGRAELPLSLAIARSRGRLVDIRTSDLRFRPAEIAEFLERTLDESFSPGFVAALAARTDGWAACLRLVTTAIFQHNDRRQFESALLEGGSTELMEFLTEEVLANILPSTRDFLLRTSVCERMCVGLADALLGAEPNRADSHLVLEEMARQDIYVSRIGIDGDWYHFHPLFREILLESFAALHGPDGVVLQHARAGTWFALHGHLEAAVRHALLAGDDQRAAELVADAGFATVDSERWHEVSGLLALHPAALVSDRPDLIVLQCWQAWHYGSIQHVPADLARAERLLADPTSHPAAAHNRIAGHIAALQTVAGPVDTDPGTVVAAAQTALKRLDGGSVVARGFALQAAASVLASSDRADEASRLIEPFADASLFAQTGLVARARIARATLRFVTSGDLDGAMADNSSALFIAGAERLAVTANTARSNAAAINLFRLDFPATRQLCSDILDGIPAPTRAVWRDAMGMLALISGLEGDASRALDLVHELVGLLETTGSVTALPSARSLRARVHLLTGQVDAAHSWAESVGSSVDAERPMYLESQAVTRARVFLAVGGRASLHQALRQIDTLLDLARRSSHAPLAASASGVRALVLDALERPDDAIAALDLPLASAERHGNLLQFIELGPPMAKLLDAIAETHPRRATIDRIRDRIRTGGLQVADQRVVTSGDDHDLTLRELEILNLLASRLSNKEIATTLSISPLTVKRHVSQIIAKLAANDRRHAIDRARERRLV